MGRLYLAHPIVGGPEVVVKVLKEPFVAQPAMRERFRREIQVLGRFQHPHVVKFHGSSVDDPAGMFLVMEYLRGRLLERLLREGSRFAPERIGKMLVQLCDVLQAAHDLGIVHCDVKPANIMVINPDTACESIKLLDFGLARTPASFALTALEMSNEGHAIEGSPGYMSPEQAAGHDVDHRADVYSLGVVLYEMFTGRLPFERASVAELLIAQRNETAPSFASRCPGLSVPPALEKVVRQCLEKHRERRPQSAGELARLYEKALGRRIVPPRPLPSLGGAVAAAPPKLETPAKLETLPKLESPPKLETASRFETPSRLETPRPAATAMVDLNAAVYKLEVRMSESIAMLKLRGFVHDLGGEVRDSEGGVIRVWLDSARIDSITSAARAPVGEDRRSWTSGSSTAATAKASSSGSVVIGLDLRLERSDPTQPNHVTITATIRARNTLSMSRRDMKERYEKIHRELQAYLQINR